MKRDWQDARDFAAGEWGGFTVASRARLLLAHGKSPRMAGLPWRQLPESVQTRLTDTRLHRGQRAIA